MIGIRMEPVDTLFFRDGTPFSSGSASQVDVGGVFPPHPASMVGSIRAALARLKGWTGSGRWPQELDETIGDADDLGKISLAGPFLLRGDQPLFPVPRHLLGSSEGGAWRPRVFLRPGAPVICDLGDAFRLPSLPQRSSSAEIADLKTGDGWWLTRAGLEAVLRDEIPQPAEVVSGKDLWSEERRIGLERDKGTRASLAGMLYSTRHVRLRRGIALGIRISGLPETWPVPFGQLVTLGGEGRLIECSEWRGDPVIGMPLEAIGCRRKMVIVALSPLDLETAVYLGSKALPGLGNARIVSACLGRQQRIGGWDSLTRRPLPLRSVLAAGSVLFCELSEPENLSAVVATHDGVPRIGERQLWGFGMVALGTWSEESGVTS
jgi:CRISPR-associated protein Cmr3